MKKSLHPTKAALRVALVHDYIKEYGGAERVLETLHEIFPDAPVYTSIYSPKYLGPHQARFAKWDIRPSILQYIPFAEKLISPLRIITPFVFKSMDLSEFDVIIVSATGAYQPNLVKKGKAKLICYCHTPPRYLYGYPTARMPSKWVLPFVHIANHILRMVDFESAQNVDQFVANSIEVKRRIQKFYRKPSVVIYPPVEVPFSKSNSKSKENKNLTQTSYSYFLCGGRLARAKRIDLAIKACIELGVKLKIFGKSFAGYQNELEEIAKSQISNLKSQIPTVEFVGEVTDDEKYTLMANAKAYIFPSEFEDFGITPVEAMGVGCPVIALHSGGVKETVIDGKTGVFFEDSSVESLVKAIKRFEKLKIEKKDCITQAKKFSKDKFVSQIDKLLD
jgi:glycosyltransferase involved in cell wall biosynthesis